MAKPEYQLRMFYSYSTLEELKYPMIHKEFGCQFDKSELKALQCPACLKAIKESDIEEDFQLIKSMDDKIRNQLVFDANKKQLVRLQKQTYCDPQNNISQIDDVKKLQVQYYKQIYQRQLQQQLKFEDIQNMNEERNQQYVKLIKELKDKSQWAPILFGVLNNKLILFYHQFKLKIELDIYEDSTAKIKQKVTSKYRTLEQILYLEPNLYFLYNKNNRSELYFGNISQVFDPKLESKFCITPIRQCVCEETARLVVIEQTQHDQKSPVQRLIMLGNNKSWSIENPHNIQDYFKKLQYLQKHSQLDVVNGKQLLVAHFYEGTSDKKNDAFAEYYYSDLNDNVDSFQKDSLSKQYKFNDYLIFGDRMILYQADQLNQEKIQAQSVCYKYSQKDNPTFYLSISIKNNASYLEPVPIASTRKLIGLISCKLIGLRLKSKEQNQPDNYLFPALQVYNQQTSTMEIELL